MFRRKNANKNVHTSSFHLELWQAQQQATLFGLISTHMPTVQEYRTTGPPLAYPYPILASVRTAQTFGLCKDCLNQSGYRTGGKERGAHCSHGAQTTGWGHSILAVLTPNLPTPAWGVEYLYLWLLYNLYLPIEEVANSFATMTHASLQQGYSEGSASLHLRPEQSSKEPRPQGGVVQESYESGTYYFFPITYK